MRSSIMALALVASASLGPRELSAQVTFLGSEACRQCHWDKWAAFRTSGHPFALSSNASTRPLPLPEGYDWSDIGWVVGGHSHKVLYLNTDGYVITKTYPDLPWQKDGQNQYNLQTGEWIDMDAGEVKRFDCGGCHTTGYGAGGVNPKPGIQGTWALDGVQCEACHGAASNHVSPPYDQITIRTNAASCGGCHRNGDLAEVPAADGFLLPNAQYNELLTSPHDGRTCIECHDPHRPLEQSIRTTCVDCHQHSSMAKKSSFKSLGRKHLDRGVRCRDCHMPYIAKSAVSESRWKGDSRSHLFKITLNPNAKMFKKGGSLSTGKIIAGYACLGCHTEQATKWESRGKPKKAEAWARKNAAKIHK